MQTAGWPDAKAGESSQPRRDEVRLRVTIKLGLPIHQPHDEAKNPNTESTIWNLNGSVTLWKVPATRYFGVA
jgi:hypothetical protein